MITIAGIITRVKQLFAGVSGGQSFTGGTQAGNNLTLRSTSSSTKGKILFGTSAYDEVNNRLGIGTTTPDSAVTVVMKAITGRERGLSLMVDDAAGRFDVFNTTTTAGVFSPVFQGYVGDNTTISSLHVTGAISTANDTGTSHVVMFTARKVPDGGDLIGGLSGNFANVATRPLFGFRNNTTIYNQINANGDFEFLSAGTGIIEKSPNGTRWRLRPSDTGASVWTALAATPAT